MYKVDFNRDFQFVFNPIPEKVKPKLRTKNKQRFSVSFYDLPNYIGEERTNFIAERIVKMKVDKRRFKIQNKGWVDVYCK